MSRINPFWTRWIWASCTKFFDDRRADYPMFIEGTDRDTKKIDTFIEFRLDGPRIREPSRNYFVLDVYINVLVQSHMDSKDAHKFQRVYGQVQSMFEPCIPVHKYGNGAGDDREALLGTLSLQNSRPIDMVKSGQFGQVDEVVRLMQATVEGHYRMSLTGARNTFSVSLTNDVGLDGNASCIVE